MSTPSKASVEKAREIVRIWMDEDSKYALLEQRIATALDAQIEALPWEIIWRIHDRKHDDADLAMLINALRRMKE